MSESYFRCDEGMMMAFSVIDPEFGQYVFEEENGKIEELIPENIKEEVKEITEGMLLGDIGEDGEMNNAANLKRIQDELISTALAQNEDHVRVHRRKEEHIRRYLTNNDAVIVDVHDFDESDGVDDGDGVYYSMDLSQSEFNNPL